MDSLSDEESLIARQQTRRCLQQYVALFLSIILSATTALLESAYTTREPYHTSILTGEGWVMELLAGHPERICCELGVHHLSLKLSSWTFGRWDMTTQDVEFHLNKLHCICDRPNCQAPWRAFSEV